MPDALLNSVWLRSVGHVDALKWSSAWGNLGCGPAQASCTVDVGATNDATLLALARRFDVHASGTKQFAGVLAEMGRDQPRTLSARGLASRAGDFDAVDGAGNPTSNPRTAVAAAITNGLPWSNPNAFDDTTLGGGSRDTTLRLDALLNRWALTVAKRWGVDVYGVAFAVADPTTPAWKLDAADLDLGVADDGLFTRVRARYTTAVDANGNGTAWAPAVANDAAKQLDLGVNEYPMDLSKLGVISPATAANYAAQQLALLSVPQWLSRVTTDSTRLRTLGGHGAHLPSVQAGQMVRLVNVPNSLGGLRGGLGVDVVLGEVEYDTAQPGEVTIAPTNLAVRNLADALAQAAETAAAA